MGVASQLVFNTFHNRRLHDWEHGGDLELAYGVARAHNRGMLEFCSVDRRLLPTCYVPLADFERARAMARESLELGAAALLVASGCPRGHSPSHVALDPVWAVVQEAGIPIVFHVGGTGDLIDPNYFRNGLPIPPDFHGGEENFRSVDYMGIPGPPMQTLATLIFDGVLERFPALRFGVIEQGAIWLPSWMRQMESAPASAASIEQGRIRLQRLGFFKTTEVETKEVAGYDDLIDVEYTVEEQSFGSIGGSVGYAQDAGLILGLNLQQNNFLGSGRRVGINLNSSRYQDIISLNYTNPYFTEDGVSRGWSVFYRKTDLSEINVASYTTDTVGANLNFGYPISETQRLGFSFGIADTKIKIGRAHV